MLGAFPSGRPHVSGAKVTAGGVHALKKAHPACNVVMK